MTLASTLTVDTVEEGVDHRVAPEDSEPGEESLGPVSCHTEQDSSGDDLVDGRVLAQDDDYRAAVEPSPIEDRSPFNAEVLDRIDLGVGVVSTERGERVSDRSRVELDSHAPPHARDGRSAVDVRE